MHMILFTEYYVSREGIYIDDSDVIYHLFLLCNDNLHMMYCNMTIELCVYYMYVYVYVQLCLNIMMILMMLLMVI